MHEEIQLHIYKSFVIVTYKTLFIHKLTPLAMEPFILPAIKHWKNMKILCSL